jgi:hypothetical protein
MSDRYLRLDYQNVTFLLHNFSLVSDRQLAAIYHRQVARGNAVSAYIQDTVKGTTAPEDRAV